MPEILSLDVAQRAARLLQTRQDIPPEKRAAILAELHKFRANQQAVAARGQAAQAEEEGRFTRGLQEAGIDEAGQQERLEARRQALPASVQDRQAEIKGLKEGTVRTVEGLGELATEANLVAAKVIDATAKGFGFSPGVTEKADARLTEFRKSVAGRRDKFERDMKREFGGDVDVDGAMAVGEIAPLVLMNPSLGIESFIGGVVKSSLFVGALSSLRFKGEGDALTNRLGDFTFGALFGGGIAVVPSFWIGARNFVANKLRQTVSTPAAKEAAGTAGAITAKIGDEFGFSLGEQAGTRLTTNLEAAAAGDIARQTENVRLDRLLKFLTKTADDLADDIPADKLARLVRGTLTTAEKALQKSRAATWDDGMASLNAEFGKDVVVRGEVILSKMDDLIAQSNDVWLNASTAVVGNRFRNLRAQLEMRVNPGKVVKRGTKEAPTYRVIDRRPRTERPGPRNVSAEVASKEEATRLMVDFNKSTGGVSVDAVRKLFRNFNQIRGGQGKIFAEGSEKMNRDVGNALLKSVHEAIEVPGSNQAALDGLALVRAKWARDSARIDRATDNVLNRFFGGNKQALVDPDVALNTLSKKSAGTLRSARLLLERYDPILLRKMQARVIRDIVADSFKAATPKAISSFSPRQLATSLRPEGLRSTIRGQGLLRPEEVKDLKTALDAARTILNKSRTPAGGFGELPVKIDDIVINAVSRSPEFMGRMLTRIVSRGATIEEVFATPAGREAIMTLARSGATDAKVKAALAFLARALRERDNEQGEQ